MVKNAYRNMKPKELESVEKLNKKALERKEKTELKVKALKTKIHQMQALLDKQNASLHKKLKTLADKKVIVSNHYEVYPTFSDGKTTVPRYTRDCGSYQKLYEAIMDGTDGIERNWVTHKNRVKLANKVTYRYLNDGDSADETIEQSGHLWPCHSDLGEDDSEFFEQLESIGTIPDELGPTVDNLLDWCLQPLANEAI